MDTMDQNLKKNNCEVKVLTSYLSFNYAGERSDLWHTQKSVV